MKLLPTQESRFTKMTSLESMLLTFWCLSLSLCAMASVPGAGPVAVHDHRDGPIIYDSGIVFGQTLRLTVAYLPDNTVPDGGLPPVRVEAILYNSLGQVIASSEERTINNRGFVSFNFKRSDLASPVEIGTGRLQVLAEIRYRSFTIVDRSQVRVWPVVSAEVIDDITGKTASVVLLQACAKGSHHQ